MMGESLLDFNTSRTLHDFESDITERAIWQVGYDWHPRKVHSFPFVFIGSGVSLLYATAEYIAWSFFFSFIFDLGWPRGHVRTGPSLAHHTLFHICPVCILFSLSSFAASLLEPSEHGRASYSSAVVAHTCTRCTTCFCSSSLVYSPPLPIPVTPPPPI